MSNEWRLVPVTLTFEMEMALGDGWPWERWEKALAAAPPPPQPSREAKLEEAIKDIMPVMETLKRMDEHAKEQQFSSAFMADVLTFMHRARAALAAKEPTP